MTSELCNYFIIYDLTSVIQLLAELHCVTIELRIGQLLIREEM